MVCGAGWMANEMSVCGHGFFSFGNYVRVYGYPTRPGDEVCLGMGPRCNPAAYEELRHLDSFGRVRKMGQP